MQRDQAAATRTYQFTRPPTCTATFTVTSTAPNGPDTPGTLPFTGSHTPQLLAIGGGLLAVGVRLLLLSGARPTSPTRNLRTCPEQPGTGLAARF